MVLLMLTTSVAVRVYFMRSREQADGRVWQTRLAPALACLGLLASLWLVLTNFTLVTGGSAALAAIPFAGLLVGALFWRPAQSMSDTGPS
jgi:Na+/proline symporter